MKAKKAYTCLYAAVVELVDTHDSKSCGAIHVGSIPTSGTKKPPYAEVLDYPVVWWFGGMAIHSGHR